MNYFILKALLERLNEQLEDFSILEDEVEKKEPELINLGFALMLPDGMIVICRVCVIEGELQSYQEEKGMFLSGSAISLDECLGMINSVSSWEGNVSSMFN